jgi:hypothetical protein
VWVCPLVLRTRVGGSPLPLLALLMLCFFDPIRFVRMVIGRSQQNISFTIQASWMGSKSNIETGASGSYSRSVTCLFRR